MSGSKIAIGIADKHYHIISNSTTPCMGIHNSALCLSSHRRSDKTEKKMTHIIQLMSQ